MVLYSHARIYIFSFAWAAISFFPAYCTTYASFHAFRNLFVIQLLFIGLFFCFSLCSSSYICFYAALFNLLQDMARASGWMLKLSLHCQVLLLLSSSFWLPFRSFVRLFAIYFMQKPTWNTCYKRHQRFETLLRTVLSCGIFNVG